MLQVRNLTVHYGKALALQGVSLDIEQGEFVALIGPNGAGKTTLLNTISGLLRPTEGNVAFVGQRLTDLPAYQIPRLGIAHCPENRRLAPEMTVLENLYLGAFHRRDRAAVARSLNWVCELFPRLGERQHQPVGTLSGGELQMVAIGRALMADPQLLMLDEPSLGLAPVVKHQIFQTLKQINTDGLTILMVEQDVHLTLKLTDRAYVLESGRVIRQGPSADLLAGENLVETFFGIGRRQQATGAPA